MLFSEDLSPELNCFFISAERHDRDRLELQFGFDGLLDQEKKAFQYTVEFLLFVPGSLGILEIDNPSTLRQEVQSYVRLHTHVTNPGSPTSLVRVKERLENLKLNMSLDTLKNFAVDLEGFIKGQTRRFRRRIRDLLQSTTLQAELKEVITEAHLIETLLVDFRQILKSRGIENRDIEKYQLSQTDHDLLLLNEYLSHVYIQHLGEIQDQLLPHAELEGLKNAVLEMAAKEASWRASNHFLLEERQGPNSTEVVDQYPRRSSILKKYFQRPLFVKDSGAPLETRLAIPIYSLSAAIAYGFFITIDSMFSLSKRFGLNTIAIGIVIVTAYAARELMKDFFKNFFLKTGGKYFSDNERKLFIENKKTGKSKIGQISEYFNTPKVDELPEKIQRIRYSVPGGDLEKELGEDIVHFKKRVKLDLEKLDANRDFPWGLREIVRYRFDRLQPNMEDPFKKVFMVSKTGHLAYRQAHRIYQLYLMAWIHSETPPKARPLRPEFKAFKLTLDKSGILSCKRLDWDKQFGTPPTP